MYGLRQTVPLQIQSNRKEQRPKQEKLGPLCVHSQGALGSLRGMPRYLRLSATELKWYTVTLLVQNAAERNKSHHGAVACCLALFGHHLVLCGIRGPGLVPWPPSPTQGPAPRARWTAEGPGLCPRTAWCPRPSRRPLFASHCPSQEAQDPGQWALEGTPACESWLSLLPWCERGRDWSSRTWRAAHCAGGLSLSVQ